VSSLLDRNGYLPLTASEAASHANAGEVEAEIRAQLTALEHSALSQRISIPQVTPGK